MTEFSPGVKRVVVTSSCAAVQQIDSVKPPHMYVPQDLALQKIAETQIPG
jgi:hypothetical protein